VQLVRESVRCQVLPFIKGDESHGDRMTAIQRLEKRNRLLKSGKGSLTRYGKKSRRDHLSSIRQILERCKSLGLQYATEDVRWRSRKIKFASLISDLWNLCKDVDVEKHVEIFEGKIETE
jgi:hypothetical protein